MPRGNSISAERVVTHQIQDKLERRKRSVIEMHIRGALPSQIAKHFEVEYMSVRRFLDRHADEIADYQKQITDQTLGLAIADKVERIAAKNDRWQRGIQVIESRATEYSKDRSAPSSAHTGLLARTIKDTKRGPVYEYKVDAGLLSQLSDLERQAAEELGQLPKADTNVNVSVGVLIRQVAGYEGDLG